MQDQAVIRCDKLTKSFGSLRAVNELSFEVTPGEILGFLGPNGAGKSTTIKMICGLLHPDSGDVLIEGKNLRKHPEIIHKIGICPQENIFWPKLTGLEQLIFMANMHGVSGKEARSRAVKILDDLGLSAKARALSSKWSGGMKRRLNIALALIHNPDILVLDEPEAGLDPQSRLMVRDYIRSLTPDKTVLLTTHNMDEADRMSDRVAIIDTGEIVCLGQPKDLKLGHETLEDVFIRLTGKQLRS